MTFVVSAPVLIVPSGIGTLSMTLLSGGVVQINGAAAQAPAPVTIVVPANASTGIDSNTVSTFELAGNAYNAAHDMQIDINVVAGRLVGNMRDMTINVNNAPAGPLATAAVDGIQSHYERASTINFVTDCGADPTGATDCTAALNTAGTLLTSLATDPKLPKQSTRLFIPRGRYLVTGNPNTWNFVSSAPSSVEVCGVRDASIFECGNGVNNAAWQIFTLINAPNIHFHDLSFTGTTDTVTPPDTGVVLGLSATNLVTIERCRFEWLMTTTAVVYVNSSALRVSDCEFGGVSSKSATNAALYSTGNAIVDIEYVRFLDPNQLNGYGSPADKAGQGVWFRHDDSAALGNAAQVRFIRLAGCWFDENCTHAVFIKGGPTARIPRVEMRGCYNNPSVASGFGSAIHIENVDLLEINGHINSGFNNAVNAAALELVSVASSHVRGFVVNSGSVERYLTADSACVSLEIEDSAFADVDLQSSATLTVNREKGIAYDLYAANGTIVANQLCKLGASGAVAIGTGDTIDVVVGAARQAASAAGRVSLSRPGQVVPMLSDGSATIAIGDNVGISGTSAGRVKTVAASAVDRVGKAVTAATNVADTVVYVQFQPFKS